MLNAGTYTVMVATSTRYNIGAYTLKGTELSSAFTRILSMRAKVLDVSFDSEGGGGQLGSPRKPCLHV